MKKHKIEPLRNTVHDQTIQKMMDDNEFLQRGNFFKTCLEAFPDVENIRDNFHGTPDIFTLDKTERTITVIEIEDYHKLSPFKLRQYAMLWGALDFYDIDFSLISYGRHGGNKQKVDLLFWYYDAMRNSTPVTMGVGVAYNRFNRFCKGESYGEVQKNTSCN